MAENQQLMTDRIADLESDVRGLLQLVNQLQREPKLVPPQPIEWVRTQGNPTGSYYDTDYPTQSMTEAVYELPAVFLDGAIPDDLADPYEWTPRSAKSQTKIISPGGWIPETIEPLPVTLMRDGRYHVLRVPELRVVSNEAIAVDDYGEFSLWWNGADTGIDFVGIYLDWMHAGEPLASGKEAMAYLDWPLRRWSMFAVEC